MNEASGFNNILPTPSTLIVAEADTYCTTYAILLSPSSYSALLSLTSHLAHSIYVPFQPLCPYSLCTVQSFSAVRLPCHMLPSAPKSVHRKWKKYIFSLCEESDLDISMTISTLNIKTPHLNKERCKSCSLQKLGESSKVVRI